MFFVVFQVVEDLFGPDGRVFPWKFDGVYTVDFDVHPTIVVDFQDR